MVFEQLFRIKHVKPTALNLFLIGFLFSEIGILCALIVFHASASVMSIAFTCLLLFPFLLDLLSYEKIKMQVNSGSFFKDVFTNNKIIIKTYILLFMGFLLSYAFFSIILPDFSTITIFKSQLGAYGLVGQATEAGISFVSILLNNTKVFFASFLFSLVFGVGSILFLIWNASVWGSVLGYIAKQSAAIVHANPFQYFIISFITFLPHLLVEAASYFFAIVAGVVISQTIIYEKMNSMHFGLTLREGLVLLGIGVILLIGGAYLEVFLFPLYAG